MADFFNDKKPTFVRGLNLLKINEYRDIHLATLQVLEKTGFSVEDEKARELFGSCGARVDETNSVVKLPASMVEDAIESAPPQVMLAGRTPDRNILLDNNNSVYINFGGGINIIDPYSGLFISSAKADLAASTRLCDALDQVGMYSRAVYPLDKSQKVLHLHTAEACYKNTSKPFLNGPESAWETKKIIEMAKAAVGGAEKLKARKPILFGSAVSSPLKLSRKICETIMTSSHAGFPTYIASMAMAGASLLIGIGGLESGLTFDFGQAILDDELVRMIKYLMQGIEINAETLSLDLIHEIGHSGNYLSHDSTLRKMKSLSQTCLFDRSNREDWEINGKPDSYARALSRAIEILETHQPEPLPAGAVERIGNIVEEAGKEVGVN